MLDDYLNWVYFNTLNYSDFASLLLLIIGSFFLLQLIIGIAKIFSGVAEQIAVFAVKIIAIICLLCYLYPQTTIANNDIFDIEDLNVLLQIGKVSIKNIWR